MSNISAAGTYIPPLFIYKGVNVLDRLLSGLSVSPGTVAGFTDTGYMHENIFRMYIEHFNKSIPPFRLVLLILDGHASHINLISINYCHDNRILLYVLPLIQFIFFNLLKYLLKNLNLNMIKLLTILDLLITKELLQNILLHKFLVKLFLKLTLLQQLEMLILQLGFGLGILMQLIQTTWHLHYQLKKS